MLITTKRLIIRDFSHEDVDPLALILGNAEVMRFSIAGPLSFDQTKDYLHHRILKHYTEHGFGLWALVDKEEDRLIGLAGLMIQAIDGEDLVELGYRLDPAYWGKRLAVEAGVAIAEYGFNELGIDKIISIIDPQNKQSVRVAAKIGMHYWKDAIFHEIPVKIYRLSKIVVAPFHSSWAISFDEARKQLKEVFGSFSIEFFHIGSTSIPNCSAKSVIDILGVTSDILLIDEFDQAMIEHGFTPLGEYGMKQRRFFQKKDGIPINLHIFEESDPEVNRHLRFCDYLRSHPDKMKQYSSLKETLAKRHPHDIQSYILGKAQLIKEIDILAAWEAPRIVEGEWKCKKSEWTEQEIKSAMLVNMHLHMTYFAKYVPTMDIVFEPDVTVVRSQIRDDTFNYVVSACFTERNARDRIRHIKSLFEKSNLPFSWWVAETDSPTNLGDALIEAGFCLKEKNIGMFLRLRDFSSKIPLSNLVFQLVESLDQLKDFATVMLSIGGSPIAFDAIYSKLPPSIYENATIELYIGYFENKPSITGVLVTHANIAGIYYVATIPNLRKRGFGTAMMKYLLERARSKGYFIATLQASEAGLSLYERLGFKRCCQFVEYAPRNKI